MFSTCQLFLGLVHDVPLHSSLSFVLTGETRGVRERGVVHFAGSKIFRSPVSLDSLDSFAEEELRSERG